MDVALIFIAWVALNLFVVMLARLQRAQLTVREADSALLAERANEVELLFDELDTLYQLDHKHPPPRREWP